MSTLYSNNIRPVSGTTDAISIDSSGRVLMGGTSVANCFNGNGEAKPFVFQGTDSGTTVHSANNLLCVVNDDDTTNNMSGFGFGWTDTDESPHYLSASINCIMGAATTGEYRSGALAFLTSSEANHAPTEKMRLTASGRLGVGTTSLSNKFQVEEDSSSNWVASYHDSRTDAHSSAGMIVFSRTSSYTGVGSITTSESSTAFNTSSDYRLKENLVGLDGALDRLAQLKTYRFNFKADPNTTVDGFVAHEVSDVVPEAVTGEKDEMETVQLPVEGGEAGETKEVERIKPQGIDQSKLVPLLVAAVQELSAKVAALESQA
jgi:hypothetical protein